MSSWICLYCFWCLHNSCMINDMRQLNILPAASRRQLDSFKQNIKCSKLFGSFIKEQCCLASASRKSNLLSISLLIKPLNFTMPHFWCFRDGCWCADSLTLCISKSLQTLIKFCVISLVTQQPARRPTTSFLRILNEIRNVRNVRIKFNN